MPSSQDDTSTTSPTELSSKSLATKWLPRLFTSAILAGLAYGARKALRIPAGHLDTYAGAPLKQDYIGMGPIDNLLARLVSAFSYPLQSEDPAPRVQLMYFAPLLGAAVMTWTVEGYRRNYKTGTFQAAYQIFGVGLVAPIYYALSIMSDKGHVGNKNVPPEIGKTILPAFLIGYAVPTLLMFWPIEDSMLAQNLIAFWQPSPIYTCILTAFLAPFYRQAAERRVGSKQPTATESLRKAYGAAFVIFSIIHVGLICYIWDQPNLSLKRIFLELPHPLAQWDLSDPIYAMFIFMKYDLAFYVVSNWVYLRYTIWDLRKTGLISVEEAKRVALRTLVGQVLVGPGATYVGVWRWREGVLAKIKGD